MLRGREVLSDPRQMGEIVETTVLRHFKAYHFSETPRLTCFPDAKTHEEVDLIVETPRETIPIEVKYREV